MRILAGAAMAFVNFASAGCATPTEEMDIENAAGPMTFEVSQDRRGDCIWILKSKNQRTIARSSEGYKSKRACDRSIELTKQAASAAVIETEHLRAACVLVAPDVITIEPNFGFIDA